MSAGLAPVPPDLWLVLFLLALVLAIGLGWILHAWWIRSEVALDYRTADGFLIERQTRDLADVEPESLRQWWHDQERAYRAGRQPE